MEDSLRKENTRIRDRLAALRCRSSLDHVVTSCYDPIASANKHSEQALQWTSSNTTNRPNHTSHSSKVDAAGKKSTSAAVSVRRKEERHKNSVSTTPTTTEHSSATMASQMSEPSPDVMSAMKTLIKTILEDKEETLTRVNCYRALQKYALAQAEIRKLTAELRKLKREHTIEASASKESTTVSDDRIRTLSLFLKDLESIQRQQKQSFQDALDAKDGTIRQQKQALQWQSNQVESLTVQLAEMKARSAQYEEEIRQLHVALEQRSHQTSGHDSTKFEEEIDLDQIVSAPTPQSARAMQHQTTSLELVEADLPIAEQSIGTCTATPSDKLLRSWQSAGGIAECSLGSEKHNLSEQSLELVEASAPKPQQAPSMPKSILKNARKVEPIETQEDRALCETSMDFDHGAKSIVRATRSKSPQPHSSTASDVASERKSKASPEIRGALTSEESDPSIQSLELFLGDTPIKPSATNTIRMTRRKSPIPVEATSPAEETELSINSDDLFGGQGSVLPTKKLPRNSPIPPSAIVSENGLDDSLQSIEVFNDAPVVKPVSSRKAVRRGSPAPRHHVHPGGEERLAKSDKQDPSTARKVIRKSPVPMLRQVSSSDNDPNDDSIHDFLFGSTGDELSETNKPVAPDATCSDDSIVDDRLLREGIELSRSNIDQQRLKYGSESSLQSDLFLGQSDEPSEPEMTGTQEATPPSTDAVSNVESNDGTASQEEIELSRSHIEQQRLKYGSESSLQSDLFLGHSEEPNVEPNAPELTEAQKATPPSADAVPLKSSTVEYQDGAAFQELSRSHIEHQRLKYGSESSLQSDLFLGQSEQPNEPEVAGTQESSPPSTKAAPSKSSTVDLRDTAASRKSCDCQTTGVVPEPEESSTIDSVTGVSLLLNSDGAFSDMLPDSEFSPAAVHNEVLADDLVEVDAQASGATKNGESNQPSISPTNNASCDRQESASPTFYCDSLRFLDTSSQGSGFRVASEEGLTAEEMQPSIDFPNPGVTENTTAVTSAVELTSDPPQGADTRVVALELEKFQTRCEELNEKLASVTDQLMNEQLKTQELDAVSNELRLAQVELSKNQELVMELEMDLQEKTSALESARQKINLLESYVVDDLVPPDGVIRECLASQVEKRSAGSFSLSGVDLSQGNVTDHDALQSEVASLQTQLAEAHAQIVALTTDCSNLKAKASADVSILRQASKGASEKYDGLVSERDRLRRKLLQSNERAMELERQLHETKETVKALSLTAATSTIASASSSSLGNISTLSELRDERDRTLAHATETSIELAECRMNLDAVREQLKSEQRRNQELEATLSDLDRSSTAGGVSRRNRFSLSLSNHQSNHSTSGTSRLLTNSSHGGSRRPAATTSADSDTASTIRRLQQRIVELEMQNDFYQAERASLGHAPREN